MHVDPYDSRGRWIIIGGTIGATFGAGGHHLPIALALGIAAGLTIGSLMNKVMPHRRD
ncbi:MAG TPA: hypothetical protein VII66_05195 [Gemmatimonadaceae bacterium]